MDALQTSVATPCDHFLHVSRTYPLLQPIGVSTYRVTLELPEPVREELPSVEDLQEVVLKLRVEAEDPGGRGFE